MFLRKFYASLACFLIGAHALSAAVLTVDNNPGAVAMFTDFPTAYAAAQNGDTLLLAGSNIQYPILTSIKKSIAIIGPGYLLAENNTLGITKKSAQVRAMIIDQKAVISNGSGVTFDGIELSP